VIEFGPIQFARFSRVHFIYEKTLLVFQCFSHPCWAIGHYRPPAGTAIIHNARLYDPHLHIRRLNSVLLARGGTVAPLMIGAVD
tara:strand:- start:121 stop:372 length:252 start_codon:yes stop_codon:yes gene_type:complete